MPHSDLYRLFAGFWWLLFPLAWGLAGLMRVWLRHVRAQKSLDVIKSFVDQGKDPPAELLEMLRQPQSENSRPQWKLPKRNWIPFGLFAGLTAGFVFALSGIAGGDGNPGLFVGLIMTGLAAGFLGNILSESKQTNNQDDHRIPPP
jgi:hypothetical protein